MIALEDFILSSDQLVEFSADFKEKPSTGFTISSLEAYKVELNNLWSEVKKSYSFCIRSSECSNDENQLKSTKARYKISSDTFVDCLSYIIDLTKKISTISEHEQSGISSQFKSKDDTSDPEVSDILKDANKSRNEMTYLKVPPCDTDIFYGTYQTWPSFRDMFTAVYVNHPKLCAVQKLYHLRAKTRGEANNIVCKFPLTSESFDLAWEALKDRFENTRILVNSQLKTLFSLPHVSQESSSCIKSIQREINDALSALKAHKVDTSNWDSILVYLCSSRLPDTTLSLWEQSIENPRTIPKWSEMDTFLTNRYQVLETVLDMRLKPKPKVTFNKIYSAQPAREKSHQSYHSKQTTFTCKLCNENHSLRFCNKFLQMTIDNRIKAVKFNNYCSNCLATSHLEKDCKSTYTCIQCKQRHHSLLHPLPISQAHYSNYNSNSDLNTTHSVIQSTQPQSSDSSLLHSYYSCNQNRVILATALVSIEHHGTVFTLRALLDPGSEVTFISEEAQMRLKLPVKSIQAHISGINAVVTANASKLCSLQLKSNKMPDFTLNVNAIVLKRLTGDLPSCCINQAEILQPLDFPLADPNFHSSSKVDLVLGADIYPSLIRSGLKSNIFGSLVAQDTIFGWVLSGPLSPRPMQCFSTVLSYFNEISLDQEISKFWEVEEISDTKSSPEDEICERLFSETTTRNAEGRYICKLPFKDDISTLGLSREKALKQYLHTENTLSKTPKFHIEYNNVLEEYLTLNHMKKVAPLEAENVNGIRSYYLPHHAVIKPESTTTKTRIVFNASSPTSNGKSLNDILFTGPSLQSDLISLILNWRFYKYVFNADITKMYRQIYVHSDHTPFQRILFRNSTNDQICDFELQTVTFGINCAPYLAIRTLKQLADDVQVQFPLTSNIIRNEFYVDDALSGSHDIETAKLCQQELIAALKSAGFTLRKWTSNYSELLASFPSEDLLSEEFLQLEEKSCAKMLGIQWNATNDSFEFSLITQFQEIDSSSITKRKALSAIAKLFDPAGWLAPIIITAKIIMQQIWRDGTSWDSPLKPLTCQAWKNFVGTLPEIQNIQIPRWIGYDPLVSIQLHGFSDSSERAYSAALYIRVTHGENNFSCYLLCAKTKVAPVKQITLPRLELCASVLLSKLVKKIIPQLKYPIQNMFLWTDSSIVLAWLKKPPHTWKTFVGNRVSQINQNVGNIEWQHVRSADNPADLATRGLTPFELLNKQLWWHGPNWLSEPQNSWPNSYPNIPVEDDLEARPLQTLLTILFPDLERVIRRFSSWTRMIRVMSYVFRFTRNSRPKLPNPIQNSNLPLSQQEISYTKTLLISLTQQLYFPNEYKALCQNKPISKKSSILTLNPYLDSDKIIRVNGRLASSTLSYNERYPIILPYYSTYTNLYVDFVHKVTLHGGNQLVVRLIRSEIWIPKLKNLVKYKINKCSVCKIYKQKMASQIMAALPKERTELSLPFTNTGCDFAGPFSIKSFAARNCRISKGYLCLFVCFATKAIHLEPTSDLSTTSFLAAFSRFVARRGLPSTIFSDNGTNFVGASKVLSNNFKLFLKTFAQDVSDKYQLQGLKWKFIPPGSPHMGGLWEAGVKSFKTHFRKVVGDNKFTFEEFSTLLSRVESCLNSRPLIPLTDNPNDILPLTPGHFLRGGPLLAPPEPDMSSMSLSLSDRWKKVQILHHNFCLRWKDEYLKELQKRYKWKYSKRDIALNDLVVIREENVSPNEWRLGRIVQLYAGSDGRVRVADVKTQNGILKRPIVKLCILLEDQDENALSSTE